MRRARRKRDDYRKVLSRGLTAYVVAKYGFLPTLDDQEGLAIASDVMFAFTGGLTEREYHMFKGIQQRLAGSQRSYGCRPLWDPDRGGV